MVLTDTATLSGATENAGGDITFTLYGPFDTLEDVSCEGEGTAVGEPVSVDGNGAVRVRPGDRHGVRVLHLGGGVLR